MNNKIKNNLLFSVLGIALLFNSCGNDNKQAVGENKTEDYLKKGMDLALATKAILGKNLVTAIQAKGTDQALVFCNERAIPLTDSMALNLNATIKRVSDKNRNEDNAANEMEMAYIEQAKKAIQEGEKATPKLQKINDQMVAYYPIVTNNMCLQCHGNRGTDINQKTANMIDKFYPNDNATAYAANELRGIWVVKMDQ